LLAQFSVKEGNRVQRKLLGAYYTPPHVVQSLVKWAARSARDRMLDPACGDGRFLVAHTNSAGVEQDHAAAAVVHRQAPGSLIHQGDFFTWAGETLERFDCAAGNPPFIRYQRFAGPVRDAALRLCRRHGARFTSLSSSWAPFIVATATLLKRGGRMAFVVPAEIGHAPYAIPVLQYLTNHFDFVQVIAVRNRLFSELSEDCWLLYCRGFGGTTESLYFTQLESFESSPAPPDAGEVVQLADWEQWGFRLRSFLLNNNIRTIYSSAAESDHSIRLSALARVGIGYVTGANDFFHLRPSEAAEVGIPHRLLQPSIRNGRMLVGTAITDDTVREWWRCDEPNFLLRITPSTSVPSALRTYLDSAAGQEARNTYKCRNRSPWYVVPDVRVPNAFLSYMSGHGPALVENKAGCVGTNSVHVIQTKSNVRVSTLQRMWNQPSTRLSCEIEGHPLGGGMLKLEPREAGRILFRRNAVNDTDEIRLILDGIDVMKRWRHYG